MNTNRIAWRVVNADFYSRNGFRWPFPGQVARAKGPFQKNGNPCPGYDGDGLCLAKTTAGAASGGVELHTVLVCSYDPEDILGEDETKLRVRQAAVLDVWDAWQLIRKHGQSANLYGADLSGANLTGTNLSRANLSRASLSRASLTGADLSRASLTGADLYGADLSGANLTGADLSRANLSRANLSRASLTGADLYGAIGYKK